MRYINTTFAYGNGPYIRCIEWAIEVNNYREKRGLDRLPIVVPLVYPKRQERIIREEIETNISPDFLDKYPYEILLDEKQGMLLSRLMFKERNYAKSLERLIREYDNVEAGIQKHLNGKRKLRNFANNEVVEIDLRDAELQLGLNNRVQTGLSNQFYTNGGAGPFDEILEKAIKEKRISLNKRVLKATIPIAKRIIKNQKVIFLNEPGVFSYDNFRKKRDNEISTPAFIHPPKPDTTELPCQGIYFIMTGIDGIRESELYDAINYFGMQIYVPEFSREQLPDHLRKKVITLRPSQINNPNIIAVYARSGWSTVWLSHMAEKGFITSPYQQDDDPEIFFNLKSIVDLKLGVILENPKDSLIKAIELSNRIKEYNNKIINQYGTLDGICYASKIVVEKLI